MSIGKRIKDARAALALSREKLAHRAGVTSTTIKRWEAGDHEPRLSDAVRLAKALEKPLGYFTQDVSAA